MARAPDRQAHWAAMQMARHGVSRAETRHDPGAQTSVGTTRSYEQSLRGLASHLRDGRIRNPASGRVSDLRTVTVGQVREWLDARSHSVSQSTLDRDRQAAQAWLSHRTGAAVVLDRAQHQSTHAGRGLASQSRVYTPEQLERIAARQSDSNGLATRVSAEAGLRAAELATLRRIDERPPTGGREWRDDRFIGRHDTAAYTVVGKGGLVREVHLSRETAEQLEARRLPEPERIRDRGVYHDRVYDIGHGNAWSKSFTVASQREVGWSAGAHAVRHVYAQQRMDQVQSRGYSYDDARAVVAQELGHFRSETTEAYLR